MRQTHRHLSWLGLPVVLLLLPFGRGVLANAAADAWPTVQFSTRVALPVASGIEYRHLTLTTDDGPLEIHQLQVDLLNPTVRLGTAIAHDRLVSAGETVTSMALRNSAIAGINGDYFDIHQSGIPLNIVVRDGQLLRSPRQWVALAVGKDGSVKIARYKWTGSVALQETGEKHPIDGFNSGLNPEGIVAISAIMGFGAPAPDFGTRQTVVELLPGVEPGRYFVKQVWPERPFYAPLPKDEIILVGRGSGADWLLAKMTAGAPIQLNLTTDPDWHEVHTVIGGGPLLVENGQVVEDPDAPAPQERDHRNPVIAVGIAQDGHTLTFVEVDGRQPSLSIGVTRPQLASYMLDLGARQAMAFDSGGSATMVARLPGYPTPAAVNSPSDGTERAVANALLIYSAAVPGPPTRLLLNASQPIRLFAGARAPITVIAVDAQGTPTSLPEPVRFTAPPQLATVGADGMVAAGTTSGLGVVRAQSGAATGTIPISVTTRLSRLVVAPTTAHVAPGAGTTFQLRGLDNAGWPVVLPEGAVAWAVKPSWLGTVLPSGAFTAASDIRGAGIITAHLGGAAAWARIAVGNLTRYVTGFDSGEWTFRGIPESVTGSVGLASSPKRLGHPSAQLAFNLDGGGTRAAYLVTHTAIPASPIGITLWAYGDGSGVWLRGTYVQSTGDPGTVTFARHVDWHGWRSVTGELPSSLSYPITWTTIYVVETDPQRMPHGVIYLSSFRAVYPVGSR